MVHMKALIKMHNFERQVPVCKTNLQDMLQEKDVKLLGKVTRPGKVARQGCKARLQGKLAWQFCKKYCK